MPKQKKLAYAQPIFAEYFVEVLQVCTSFCNILSHLLQHLLYFTGAYSFKQQVVLP